MLSKPIPMSIASSLRFLYIVGVSGPLCAMPYHYWLKGMLRDEISVVLSCGRVLECKKKTNWTQLEFLHYLD